MITVQVRNEDIVYTIHFYVKLAQLHLSTLSTIDQKQPLMRVNHMSGWESCYCGQSRATTQYCYRKYHLCCSFSAFIITCTASSLE